MEHALRFVEGIKIYLPNKTGAIPDRGLRRVDLHRKKLELIW